MWWYLKTRIISALVMAIIALPILFVGGIPFRILAVLLSILSLYELFKVRDSKIPIIIKVIAFLILGVIVYIGNINILNYVNYKYILLIFMLFFIPVVLLNDNDKYNYNDAIFIVSNILFLGFIYNIFIFVRNNDLNYFVYLLLITIITDTFALVGGKFIGKHKLCEKISPKKTIEGAIAGSICGTIISVSFYLIVINQNSSVFKIALITLILSIIGQIGDLFFSSIKRYYKVKDFSNLIPGHGGILDRLDSFIFVIIFYVLLINLL